MLSLPMLVEFDLRPFAARALADMRPLLPAEDRLNGIHWGLYGLIDPSFDCPANLYRFDEDWTHGPANEPYKRRAMMWQQTKALQFANYCCYENPDALSGFDKGSRDRSKGRKGGAIRLDVRIPETGKTIWDVVLSAAGTNELADEAFLLRLARLADWELLDRNQLDEIAALSNNSYFMQLKAA